MLALKHGRAAQSKKKEVNKVHGVHTEMHCMLGYINRSSNSHSKFRSLKTDGGKKLSHLFVFLIGAMKLQPEGIAVNSEDRILF